MSRFYSYILVVGLSLGVIFSLVGCATSPTAATPTLAPTARVEPPTVAPTPAPTPTTAKTADPRVVVIPTTDGARLDGTLYGQGTTAVIFSAMGAHRQDTWAEMAQEVAKQGYLALTYNYRFWVSPTSRDEGLYKYSRDDLRAAIAFARQQGAKKIALVGASWGGMLSAMLASREGVHAVIIMASPPETRIQGEVFRVETADLAAITVPKLFMSTENDRVVPNRETRRLYDAAPDPKEWQIFPGDVHGTELFATPAGADLKARILTFLKTHTPPGAS